MTVDDVTTTPRLDDVVAILAGMTPREWQLDGSQAIKEGLRRELGPQAERVAALFAAELVRPLPTGSAVTQEQLWACAPSRDHVIAVLAGITPAQWDADSSEASKALLRRSLNAMAYRVSHLYLTGQAAAPGCQVANFGVNLPCPHRESGGFRCTRMDVHTVHDFDEHTIRHALAGNGYACGFPPEGRLAIYARPLTPDTNGLV